MNEKIFISYNHNDTTLIDTIARRLEIEFGRNNIFYDAWSIQPGDSIIGKMNEGLELFTTFFFFISPNSLSSKMVSLEWQLALNKAVKEDLKFVPVKISECDVPAILSNTQYIDLYGEGLDSAVEKMKCTIKAESTYKPLEDVDNLKAIAKRIDVDTYEITIEALMFSEQTPTFAFACTNPLEDFDVNFHVTDGVVISGVNEITTPNNKTQNAKTVQIQRALKPGFPFIFSVTAKKSLHDVSIYILINAAKRAYREIQVDEI